MSKARTLASTVSTGAVLADGTIDASEIGSLTLPTGGDIVGTTSTQTLTNKTIAYADNTLTGVVGTTATQTLTNKTIDIASNTLTGVQASLVSGTNIKTVNSTSLLGSGDVAVGDATLSGSQTFTGTKTFTGTSSALAMILNDAAEVTTVSATAATGTINFDVTTQSVLYYTSNASGNWTLNIRASSGTSLDTALATGQSVTVAFMVTNGATAYYQTGFQVDGNAVTPKWQGGTAPTGGNASSIDVYSCTVIKTGSATFTALLAQTKFA